MSEQISTNNYAVKGYTNQSQYAMISLSTQHDSKRKKEETSTLTDHL